MPSRSNEGSRANDASPRGFLSHAQRLAILQQKRQHPRWTQTRLAQWAVAKFRLSKAPSQATISTLLRHRTKLETVSARSTSRSLRAPKHPQLETALVLWVRSLQSRRIAFTGESIRMKAALLAEVLGLQTSLCFSTGWTTGFLQRHGLVLARAHKQTAVDHTMRSISDILHEYSPRDLFSMRETGVVFNTLPSSGVESFGDRVCVGLGVNMDRSEKLPPFVVARGPFECGGNVMGFVNAEARMTAGVFEEWLQALNARMAAADRRIALIVDSSPSHFHGELSHVRLYLLSEDSVPCEHPLKASVLPAFKALFRKKHLAYALVQADRGGTNIFDVGLSLAVHWIEQAWNELSPECIRACWARSGWLVGGSNSEVDATADMFEETIEYLKTSLLQLDPTTTTIVDDLIRAHCEDDVHYIYDDATVARMVACIPDAQEDANNVDHLLNSSSNEFQDTFESQSTINHDLTALCTHYRGVIESLEAEASTSEEQAFVLDFLRQKEVMLLDRQQPPPDHLSWPAATSTSP